MIKPLVLLIASLLAIGFAQAEPRQNLLDIYQQALSNDPSLSAADYQNQADQEIVIQAKSTYRPNVNFSAGANTTRTDIEYNGGNTIFRPQSSNRFESYNYGVQARQPIYRKANLINIDQSQLRVSQADKQLTLIQQDLILRTTQAYFDVLNTQDQIVLIDAQKQAIQSQLEQAKATFDVGTSTITDVNEAQARFDLIVAQEIAANNAHEVAKRALQAIIGHTPEKLATVKADIAIQPLTETMEEWEQRAIHHHPNIHIQQDNLAISALDKDLADAARYPVLDAVASYDHSYSNGSANGFGSDLDRTIIGVELQVPIYQGGSISSKQRQAALQKYKAQDDIEVAKRQVSLNTQRAYLDLNSSIAQVKALEQALKSSQSQLDSTKLGYEVGVRTSVDVLNAQQQFYSAKRDLLQSRYAYLVHLIQLKTVAGTITQADLETINQQLEGGAS